MKTDTPAATRHAPTHDPFSTRDAMLDWMQDIAPYGVFTTDSQLVIRSWNQWLETHSGLTGPEAVGRRLLEVFPDLGPRRLETHYLRALHGEVSVLSSALHRYLVPLPPSGPEFGVARMLQTARIAPLPSGDAIIGTITIIEDVTQRECQAALLRRQQAHDRLLSEALALLLQSERPMEIAPALFQRIAHALHLEVYFNFLIAPGNTAMRLHASGGLSTEAEQALAEADVRGPGPCSRSAFLRQAVHLPHVQTSSEAPARLLRPLGLRCYAAFPLLVGERLLGTLAYASRQRDLIAPDELEFLGTVAQYVANALDRSQREDALREAQQRLHRHAEELEVKIAERTAKLRDIIEQLERFSSTVAHDLRAPIRSLIGFSEILLTDFSADVPAEARDLLRRLLGASQRLDALTRDLLKFSRIVGEDVVLDPVDVDDLVQDIMAATPGLQGGVLIVDGPLGSMRAQRTLLQQCLSNLLDNALKFTPAGVKPRIRIRGEDCAAATPGPEGTIVPFRPPALVPPARGLRRRLWIEDNGIGIPATAHGKIFGIFERLPGPVPVEGTGIGLAIVARASEQMGGTCGVDSAPGQGSRFWLEFAAVMPPGA